MSSPAANPAPAPSSGHTAGEGDLPKQYRPADHEPRIWDRWIAAKAFHADPLAVIANGGSKDPYCILIPPPNVTAALHLGHALNNTLQDVLVRAHRMKGFESLWMPGTDHAGIATQAVVEKRLRKEGKLKGALKQAMGREEFVAHVQAFKDEYEAVITGQLQKMGCSCDWDRQRFTMDSVCARAVREAFFILFRDGLIYRGKRLVNWDPALQTAVADDECYDEEVDSSFWYLRYPLVHAHGPTTARERAQGQPAPDDAVPVTWSELAARGYPGAEQHEPEQQAWVTVATTRPETYLGDTAVAVNPHDPRAKALRGLSVELPLVGRVIPIIEDSYVVLPKALARDDDEANDPKAEFATGFLKVTPAHDAHDAEIGQRHVLPAINMMSPDGRVSDKHGWTDLGDAREFVGLKMADARKAVVKAFEARGLLESVRPYRQTKKFSDRSKAEIEPYLSDQWYVRVTDPRMAAAANAALVAEQRTNQQSSEQQNSKSGTGDGSMRFYPARYAKSFEHWHDNIRDWCISRQLWWGHRIPVWSKGSAAAVSFGTWEGAPDPIAQLDAWRRAGRIDIWYRKTSAQERSGQNPLDTVRMTSLADIEHAECQQIRFMNVAVRDGEDDVEVVKFLHANRFEQDPDVLDTWFSSGLWPLSTLGWPDPALAAKETGIQDFPRMLDAFNPSTVLCTAREIITLWVSRMTMFNRYLRSGEVTKWRSGNVTDASHSATSSLGHSATSSGPPPFRDVFIHAVIQDGEGRKMSKSLGNGVDPLDIIATHGADAMRFTLCQMATNTQDVRLPVVKDPQGRNTSPKFDNGRNFATKLWNAAKFAMEKLATPAPGGTQKAEPTSLPDRWILARLAATIAACDRALAHYEFADYSQSCYTFLWNDFCDWYLEAVKPTVAADPAQQAVLRATLDATLRLLHPVMPFVTETIYERFSTFPAAPVAGLSISPPRKAGLLATAGWPDATPALADAAAEAAFARVQALVTAVREVKAQHNAPYKRKVTLHMPQTDIAALGDHATLVVTLANLEAISPEAPQGPSVVITADAREYRVSNLADQAAVDTSAERARLEKVIADLDKSAGTLRGRLNNPGYTDKAPPHMVQQTRDQLAKVEAELAAASKALESL